MNSSTDTDEPGEDSAEELAAVLPSKDDDNDETYTANTSSPRDDTITLSLPRTGLLDGSSELASRLNLSHRKATALTAQFVKMGGGSLHDCTLSTSSAYRHRKRFVTKKAEEIRLVFRENIPKYVVLHWDSKVIKYDRHHDMEDRLAIVASFPGSAQPLFLGAPRIADGRGTTMSGALGNALHEWSIPFERVIGLCWDTTASNTGRHAGAATVFQRQTKEQKL